MNNGPRSLSADPEMNFHNSRASNELLHCPGRTRPHSSTRPLAHSRTVALHYERVNYAVGIRTTTTMQNITRRKSSESAGCWCTVAPWDWAQF